MKKVILITGASSGIGKETALLLAKDGHKVYAAARRVEKMEELAVKGIQVMSMDITGEDSVARTVRQIIQNENRIDVLVNNAGYGSYGALEDVPISEAKYQFEVNIFGLARLTQLVLPWMRAQASGRIINVSSMGGKFGEPHGAWYHATKYAVEGLSDSLRMELKQFGIDVVVVQPGIIKTEWNHIARENLLKASGNTPYENLARKHVKLLEKVDEKGSHPRVIAKVIGEAVVAQKPKTRYVAGSNAKAILFLKSLLPDSIFDAIMLYAMR